MTKQTMANQLMAAVLALGLTLGCATADRGPAGKTADPYARNGFFTQLDTDGRLWVFRTDSQDLADYQAKGKPARHVVRPNAGPGGVTVKSTDSETIIDYVTARPGFFTQLDKDGRLWVFRTGSPDLADFQAKGKPARHVVRPGAGPLGLTLKATEFEVLDAYRDAME